MDNTTELWMTKYLIGEIFSSGDATLYKNPSDQTVMGVYLKARWAFYLCDAMCRASRLVVSSHYYIFLSSHACPIESLALDNN